MIRKIRRGVELFGAHRFSWHRGWQTKPHPYFFYAKYPGGSRTLQIMWFEYWYFSFANG